MNLTQIPLATALRESLKSYNLSTFKHDFFAALVVSMMALPLSMALSVAVGLPPQYGVYTAIVAGIVTPLLGGSLTQVSGPTAAFVVILAPIVAEFGLRGLVWSGLLAGIVLVFMGCARFGKLIHYVPSSVVTGFTAGIAVVLILLSMNDFLGLNAGALTGSFLNKLTVLLTHLPSISWAQTSIGIVSLILLFIGKRFLPFIPSAIVAMSVAIAMALWYQNIGIEIATIGNRFEGGLPGVLPVLHWPTFEAGHTTTIPSFDEFRLLLVPAFSIAMLAALESLLSAKVADKLMGTKHDPNAELNGIGIGNIFSALALGIPATGAIARTATNIHNGGKTPLSATMHAVLILLYVLLFAPFINFFPMAALAALLIHAGCRMSHAHELIDTLKQGMNAESLILLTSFIFTVFVDMLVGVGMGLACAAICRRRSAIA